MGVAVGGCLCFRRGAQMPPQSKVELTPRSARTLGRGCPGVRWNASTTWAAGRGEGDRLGLAGAAEEATAAAVEAGPLQASDRRIPPDRLGCAAETTAHGEADLRPADRRARHVPPSRSPPTNPSPAGPRRSLTRGSALPSSTGSPSAATSSRPAPSPTASPTAAEPRQKPERPPETQLRLRGDRATPSSKGLLGRCQLDQELLVDDL